MNDDELRAQLERRANIADPGPGFAAAVRDAIDTRPIPVRASRLAPLAGLVGIAAALILLVVALPRYGPDGPGPSVSTSAISSTERSGDFTLTISSARSDYSAGEPIHVVATFAYGGATPVITVTGATELIGFGIEQQDGDIRNGPAWDEACRLYELSAGVPLVTEFSKSGGFSNSGPDAEFWRAYFNDPILRLPAGTWRIFAVAQFGQQGCGSELEMSASIVIRVQPSEPVKSPTPNSSPSASPKPQPCSTLARLVDWVGIVESCTPVDPPSSGEGVVQSENLSAITLTWTHWSCMRSITIDFGQSGRAYQLEIVEGDIIVEGCSGVGVLVAVEIRLSREVPGATIKATLDGRRLGSGTGSAWWELAPDERPTDSSTELRLVVYEYSCASGVSPEGRIEGPTIEYGATEVAITFEVRPRPGDQDCPSAPGAPVTVTLTEPLGNRTLIDGDAGPVVIERSAGFLALSSGHVDALAHGRFQALVGPSPCRTSIYDRYVPTQAELEAMAGQTDGEGLIAGGWYKGDWLGAARAFGAIEAYEGRPKPWYIVRLVDGVLALVSLDPFPISGGRTLWYPGFYSATVCDLLVPRPSADYAPDELIVEFCSPPTQQEVDAFKATYDLVLKHHSAGAAINMYVFKILDGTDPKDKAAAVADETNVCRTSPNWRGVTF